MKQSKTRVFASFVRGLLRGRRKQGVAMETYLDCIPLVQKLIDRRCLGINLKERLVVLDESVHRAFLPQRFTSSEMARADRRYAAFFDKVVAYMNFKLGELQRKDFIDPEHEPIPFLVTLKEMVVGENGEPVPAHLQVRERTLLVGKYVNGVVDYKAVEDGQM